MDHGEVDHGEVDHSEVDHSETDDAVDTRLLQVMRDVLGRPGLRPTDDFFEAGGGREDAGRVASWVRSVLEVPCTAADLRAEPRARQLARTIRARYEASDRFARIGTAPPGRRLFALATEEGDARLFRRMVGQGLDAEVICLFPLAIPADPVADTFQAYAGRYVDVIRSLDPAGPYYLTGFSAMGLCAVEVASQLRATGCPVPAVMLLDTPHPACALRDGLRYKLKSFAFEAPVRSALPRIEGRIADGEISQADGLRELIGPMGESAGAGSTAAKMVAKFARWIYGALMMDLCRDIRTPVDLRAVTPSVTPDAYFDTWVSLWSASTEGTFLAYRFDVPDDEEDIHHALLKLPEVAGCLSAMIDGLQSRTG